MLEETRKKNSKSQDAKKVDPNGGGGPQLLEPPHRSASRDGLVSRVKEGLARPRRRKKTQGTHIIGKCRKISDVRKLQTGSRVKHSFRRLNCPRKGDRVGMKADTRAHED